MKRSLLALLLLAPTASLRAQSPEAVVPTPRLEIRHTIHSRILGEERPYLVHLPETYADSSFGLRSFPVVYLLDGEDSFDMAMSLLDYMSPNAVPEHILIAIPNTNRTRDLTPTHSELLVTGDRNPGLRESGGGDSFLDFLEQELMPDVEQRYRTRPIRTFVGHSLGGLAVLHAFVHRKGLFDFTLAIDPSLWWDEERLIGELEQKVASGWEPRGTVYISNAGIPGLHDYEDFMGRTGEEFAAVLDHIEAPAFRVRREVFSGEEHGSVALPSFYYGMRYFFDGYLLSEGDWIEGADYLAARREQAVARIGHSFPIDPLQLDQMGRRMARGFLSELGLEYLRYNLSQHPDAARAHASLGRGLLAVGDTSAAVVHLGHALDREDNPELRALLERLAKRDQ